MFCNPYPFLKKTIHSWREIFFENGNLNDIFIQMGAATRSVRPAFGLDPLAGRLAASYITSCARNFMGLGIGMSLTLIFF
jgi:hypothetical protein